MHIQHDTFKSMFLYCAVKGDSSAKKKQEPPRNQDPGNRNAASVNEGGTRSPTRVPPPGPPKRPPPPSVQITRTAETAAPVKNATQTGTSKPGATGCVFRHFSHAFNIQHDTNKSLLIYCAVKGTGPVNKQQGPNTDRDPGNGNAASVNEGGTRSPTRSPPPSPPKQPPPPPREQITRTAETAALVKTATQTGTRQPGATGCMFRHFSHGFYMTL